MIKLPTIVKPSIRSPRARNIRVMPRPPQKAKTSRKPALSAPSAPSVEDSKGFPLLPSEAVRIYGNTMLEIEKFEIQKVEAVYYVRPFKIERVVKSSSLFPFVADDHVIFRYQQVSQIGRGAFGSVIKCIDHKTGESVAIKFLKDTYKQHKQILLELEFILHVQKQCPSHSIINVLNSFSFRGYFCIVFELLSIDLYESLRASHFRGLSTDRIRLVAFQVSRALTSVHGSGVVHCDIKPENIVWTTPRRVGVKLIDFGCACWDGKPVYSYIQSRYYRAPEVILGIPYGAPMDIWSYGCVLYELYTGKPLFPGKSEEEQMMLYSSVLGSPPYEWAKTGKRSVDIRKEPHAPGSRPLSLLLMDANQDFVDLISQCIKWLPGERILASEIPGHPFFKQ